jgi:predicted house-cleaning noncanonical NTP pyrophosphatase (MazG superfamily)
MSREIHNKLIRDKIPEIMTVKKIKFKVSKLNNKQFSKALKNKLLEEVIELKEAKTKDELLNELADVKEVFEAILKDDKISLKDVVKKQQKKRVERGGFEKKLFLRYVDKEEKEKS